MNGNVPYSFDPTRATWRELSTVLPRKVDAASPGLMQSTAANNANIVEVPKRAVGMAASLHFF
jgi:hypothetical protein